MNVQRSSRRRAQRGAVDAIVAAASELDALKDINDFGRRAKRRFEEFAGLPAAARRRPRTPSGPRPLIATPRSARGLDATDAVDDCLACWEFLCAFRGSPVLPLNSEAGHLMLPETRLDEFAAALQAPHAELQRRPAHANQYRYLQHLHVELLKVLFNDDGTDAWWPKPAKRHAGPESNLQPDFNLGQFLAAGQPPPPALLSRALQDMRYPPHVVALPMANQVLHPEIQAAVVAQARQAFAASCAMMNGGAGPYARAPVAAAPVAIAPAPAPPPRRRTPPPRRAARGRARDAAARVRRGGAAARAEPNVAVLVPAAPPVKAEPPAAAPPVKAEPPAAPPAPPAPAAPVAPAAPPAPAALPLKLGDLVALLKADAKTRDAPRPPVAVVGPSTWAMVAAARALADQRDADGAAAPRTTPSKARPRTSATSRRTGGRRAPTRRRASTSRTRTAPSPRAEPPTDATKPAEEPKDEGLPLRGKESLAAAVDHLLAGGLYGMLAPKRRCALLRALVDAALETKAVVKVLDDRVRRLGSAEGALLQHRVRKKHEDYLKMRRAVSAARTDLDLDALPRAPAAAHEADDRGGHFAAAQLGGLEASSTRGLCASRSSARGTTTPWAAARAGCAAPEGTPADYDWRLRPLATAAQALARGADADAAAAKSDAVALGKLPPLRADHVGRDGGGHCYWAFAASARATPHRLGPAGAGRAKAMPPAPSWGYFGDDKQVANLAASLDGGDASEAKLRAQLAARLP
ncbi:hypothetical protein JL722_4438 [Aureococcus anophagefferens]|nr:hypothetical protein JL722_4438 [Aureococcus anophagefferens]